MVNIADGSMITVTGEGGGEGRGGEDGGEGGGEGRGEDGEVRVRVGVGVVRVGVVRV